MVLGKSDAGPNVFGSRVLRSTRSRLALVISLVAIIPLFVSSLLLVGFFEDRMVAERKTRLYMLASHLAQDIQVSAPETLSWVAGNDNWQTAHQRIAPFAESLVAEYDDSILGFYSAKYGAYVAYAPESRYAGILGQPLPSWGVTNQVYDTKQPIVTNGETLAGPGLVYVYPMVVEERVIGHVFAIITHTKLQRALLAVRIGVAVATVLLCLLVFAVASALSRYLTREVDTIVRGMRRGKRAKREAASAIPELSRLLDEVELKTDSLRQERQRTFDLLDALPMGIMAYDSERRLLFTNQTAAEMLGISKRDAVGQDRTSLLAGRSWTDIRSSMSSLTMCSWGDWMRAMGSNTIVMNTATSGRCMF